MVSRFPHASSRRRFPPLAFDPVLRAPDGSFRAAFTASRGWGSHAEVEGAAALGLRHGRLELRELALAFLSQRSPRLQVDGQDASLPLTRGAGQALKIE